jgi:hypothetical protein
MPRLGGAPRFQEQHLLLDHRMVEEPQCELGLHVLIQQRFEREGLAGRCAQHPGNDLRREAARGGRAMLRAYDAHGLRVRHEPLDPVATRQVDRASINYQSWNFQEW